VHPFGRLGNIVRTPFRVQEEIVFLSQTQIGNSNCSDGLQIQPDDHLCREPSNGSSKYLSGQPFQIPGRFCTCFSIFIITLCSSIELRQNWCRWKANKNCYNLTIRTAQSLDGKTKHLDGPESGWKDQASGRSPEFEKFQNSFSDTETVDRLDPQDCSPDTHARESDSD
jgi:hypothetical protein